MKTSILHYNLAMSSKGSFCFNFILSSIANQFWSDPRYMSSYMDATFKPRAARPGEVVLLVPNIFKPGETIPVNIPQEELLNLYMNLLGTQSLPQLQQTTPAVNPNTQPTQQQMRATWYFISLNLCLT